ncbi:McrC family protein [Chryseobacterium salipaludis]|uniref:McrC family protein n=1 Tax=Chryseobacterium TaxID=59732 RepID=UPI001FF22B67|nr:MULTISPECIES: McrC family protein [Chryseobacterium]MCJ8498046.1 McrC family protein [Chryseobacterium salipaludis]MCX3296755.1 McrC family protein [Planobacterium sp. JC490]
MKILLSEHKIQTIIRGDHAGAENDLAFADDLFAKLDANKIKAFKSEHGRNIYPFHLSLKEHTCELRADYYVGVDWLIEGEKFVQVEPKLNTSAISSFVKKTETDEFDHQKTREDDNPYDEPASEEAMAEVDYLRMLLELAGNPYTVPFIPAVLTIDWEAEPIILEQRDDRLTPFLIVQFLQLLKSIVRKGLKKSYYTVDQNLANRVKGKILVGQNIKQNVLRNRMTRTVCRYQEFGSDTLENRFLKKVLTFATHYVRNDKVFFKRNSGNKTHSTFEEELLHIINYCRPAFEHVSDDVRETDLKNIKYNPFFQEYKEAIQLGSHILKKYSYNISNTAELKVKTPPFWIDMPLLFELFVYHKLLKANPSAQNKIIYQFGTYGNYLDLLVKDGANSMIIDAKYKLHYQHSHIHHDIRQVSGYARLRKVRQEVGLDLHDDRNIACLIIYPTMSDNFEILNLDSMYRLINDNKDDSPFAIKAYHQVYKMGVALPVI